MSSGINIEEIKKQLETKSPKNPLIDETPIDRYQERQQKENTDPNIKEFRTSDQMDEHPNKQENIENYKLDDKKEFTKVDTGNDSNIGDQNKGQSPPDFPDAPDSPRPFEYTGDSTDEGIGDTSFNEIFDTDNMDKTIDWICGMFKVYYPKMLYGIGKVDISRAKSEVSKGNLEPHFLDTFQRMNDNVRDSVQLDEDTFKIWKKQTKELAKEQNWSGMPPGWRWAITTGLLAVPPAIEVLKVRKDNQLYFRQAIAESRRQKQNISSQQKESQPKPPTQKEQKEGFMSEDDGYKRHMKNIKFDEGGIKEPSKNTETEKVEENE